MTPDFYDLLYNGYTGEYQLMSSLYRNGLDAVRPPADMGIDVISLNLKDQLENPDHAPETFFFQVKTAVTSIEKSDDHPGVLVTVTFKLKPSDAAYATYAGNQQYPNAGEPNTGTASAGQRGFYSNVDARLNYCVLTEVNRATSCARTEVEYPHPVVQVKLGKIKIVKQWSDGASKHDDGSVTVRKACAAAEHTTAESVQTASASPVRSRLQRPTRGFRASAPRAASHCGVLALLAGGI